MKTGILRNLALPFLLLLPCCAYAQDTPPIVLNDSYGESVVRIENYDKDAFDISIGNYMVSFGKKQPPPQKNRARKRLTFLSYIDFGFNGFTDPNYSKYPDGTIDFLDLKNGRSISVGIGLFGMSLPVDRKGKLRFNPCIGIEWNDYVFSNNITLKREGGMIVPHELEKKYKKSKLNTFSFTIPLDMKYRFSKRMFVSLGPYVNMTVGDHTKVKKPKHKEREGYYVNFIQPGIKARFGFRSIYVFGSYGFVQMFQSGKGPKTHPYTIGFGI